MIDLTPLDVRNKRGDFKKIMRGYDPPEVDVFLELVAERMEALVRENLQLRERTQTLQSQVDAQAEREQAVQDALVTAQELRADIQTQSQREADHIVKEAEVEARRLLAEADAEVRSRLRGIERRLDLGRDALEDLERRRARFLKEFRNLLERELDVVHVEEGRAPFENRAVDMDLGAERSEPAEGGTSGSEATVAAEAPGEEASTGPEPEATEAGSGTEDVVADLATAPEADAVGAGPGEAERGSGVAGGSPAVEASADAPPSRPKAPPAPELDASADAGEPEQQGPVDVGELQPDGAIRPSAPPPKVGSEPSSLELELMAGAAGPGGGGSSNAEAIREQFPDVPDLETVLAEAGMEEVQPPPADDIAPPPPPGVKEDNVILFDPGEQERKR